MDSVWMTVRILLVWFTPQSLYQELGFHKYWLAWNWVNVSEWSDMSTRWLMFQWASTIKIQIRVLVYIDSGPHLINCNLFLPWYGWKIAHLALNNNHSLTPIAYIQTQIIKGHVAPFMKRIFKQRWSTIPPLTTLRNNRLSPQLIEIMNIKFTTYDVPNPMHKLVHGTLNFNQFIQHV
jgi:hypothetical protein